MPLAMSREVFVTCAVTGAGAAQGSYPCVRRMQRQIDAIDTFKAAKDSARARRRVGRWP